MIALEKKRQQLIEDLSIIEDPDERFALLIDEARKRPPLPDEYKTDEFLVRGCQSQLWIVPEFRDGLCYFKTDSDAVITKGIAGLLTDFYSGNPPHEILQVGPEFLSEVGITQHLSPNRRNGLTGVWERIRSFAEACCQASGKTG